MDEDTNSRIRRTKFSHTLCHRLDPSRLSSIPISIHHPEHNSGLKSRPAGNTISNGSQIQRNPITNKQRSVSPLPETFVSETFREARHEQKRFSTPGPRRYDHDKRIMGKLLNKDSRESKLSSSKSLSTCPNRQVKLNNKLHYKYAWTKYFDHGGGRVTAVETGEEWTVDLSKLFLGLRFAHGAHSRLYHGVYKEEPVAVKIIMVPDDDENGTLASRLEKQFIREVNLLSHLHHRNVIKIQQLAPMVGAFDVGAVPFNPDGWGPPDSATAAANSTNNNLPLNVPFAPFSRSDKLGRIADWTRNFNNPSRPKNPADSVFDFANDDSFPASADDDSSFRLVDGKPPPRPKFGPKWRFQQQRQLPQRRDEEVEARKREAEKERARRDRLYHLNRSNPNAPRREAAVFKSSVDIQPEWNMRDQIPFSTFSKLSFTVPEPEDLLFCGALEYYDRTYDRITPKNERRLERFKNRNFFKVTTTDDPVIRRLANEDKATVFATDTILSTLMCAPRSVYSWDIVVQRVGNKLFFDKRDGSQLDLLSVHETSLEPLPEAKDDINSAHSLSVEAAYINQNFSQQVLIRDGNKVTFDEANPFANEGEEVASVAYRYRRWKLDDDMYLVARCEVQSVLDLNKQRSYLTLNALNEFDPKYSGVDWRQKLETQRGAVLATELKNNANKLAKWTAQALLANADMMKLGYVSRIHPRDHFNHVILAVVGYKPKDFAAQINLNTPNMWGIVKSIVDLCMKLEEGKYVLVKDPSKPQVRIYQVPPDAFENDYVEEPLPEEEQVQPPAEGADGGEATATTNDVDDNQIDEQA